jgi:putative endonuclease
VKNLRISGGLGEKYALTLLEKAGYKIIEKNFHSYPGEIDIIAIDPSGWKEGGNTLVFVEVKTRWSDKYGKPEEAVGAQKLQRIRKTGEYYVLTHPNLPKKLRIDVVAIEVRGGRVISSKIIKAI